MPTKLDLPASDRRVKSQLNASEKQAKELTAAGFGCCTWKTNGTACAGAGKLVRTEDGMKLTCANQCSKKEQGPRLMTPEEASQCTKKTRHKTPYG